MKKRIWVCPRCTSVEFGEVFKKCRFCGEQMNGTKEFVDYNNDLVASVHRVSAVRSKVRRTKMYDFDAEWAMMDIMSHSKRTRTVRRDRT